MLRISAIEDVAGLESLETAWWDLWRRVPSPEPTMSPSWVITWWKTFGDSSRRALSLAAYDGERLVGLVCFVVRTLRHRRLLPLRRLELAVTGEDEREELNSDFVGLLTDRGLESDVASGFAEWLVSHAQDWDDLSLTQMDGHTGALTAFELALAERTVFVHERRRGTCPTITLPARFEGALPSGAFTLKRIATPDEAWRHLTMLGDERFRARDRFAAFHAAVLPKLLAHGVAEIAVLLEGDRPLTMTYHLLCGSKLYVYAVGAHEEVITPFCVRDAIARGFAEYTFSNGDTPYRAELARGNKRIVVTVVADSPSMRGRAVGLVKRASDLAVTRARAARELVRR